MDKRIYLSIMAAVATSTAVWLIALLAAPFARPLAWALIIGIATIPHHQRLVSLFPNRPGRAAGLMVGGITLCIILPVATVIVMIAENAADWYRQVEQLVQAFSATGANGLSRLPLAGRIGALGERLGLDLSGYVAKIATGASQFLLDAATSAAKNLAELIFTLAMALFILFFIYRDGEKIVFAGVARFATDQKKVLRYLADIRATTTAVTVGTILTCFVQGALAGVGYFIAGLPAPALCGMLTAVAALVPVVGTGIIWVPLALLLALGGAYVKAGLLALWCIVFVGLADNAIRPLAIGAKSNIPTPAIVLGAIGGATTMGLVGLIFGPLVFAILVTLWRELTEADEPAAPTDFLSK